MHFSGIKNKSSPFRNKVARSSLGRPRGSREMENDSGRRTIRRPETYRKKNTKKRIGLFFFLVSIVFLTNRRLIICICTFVPLAREVFLFSLRHSVISEKGRVSGRNKCIGRVMVTEKKPVEIRNTK